MVDTPKRRVLPPISSTPYAYLRFTSIIVVVGVAISYANASTTTIGEPTEVLEDQTTLFTRYTGLNTSLVASIVVSSDDFLESCSNSDVVGVAVEYINVFLTKSGVPKKSLITTDEFVLAFLTIICTLLSYYFLMGKNHIKKRRRLAAELKIAQEKVTFLEEKLMLSHAEDMKMGNKKEVRIFMDGAFDMMHYGHMNAFRLGRSLGTHLIVGVNSDESITQCKGAPLMKENERMIMVKGCKFVDEVVPNCPYIMNEEYLNFVIKKYKVDYVIHGDDPCIVDGKDVYESAKKAGKYQSIPRTQGVSTTDIVGRMLLMSKDHHCDSMEDNDLSQRNDSLLCEQSKFLTTSRLLRLFSAGMKSPKSGMKVIYIDGAWDMFHCGHVSILEEAKKRGDYLIVGIHCDAVVNRERGCNLPIMNLHERVLAVMGCRFVDDVLIDAPTQVTSAMIASLGIHEVVSGTTCDDLESDCGEKERLQHPDVPFTEIPSPTDFGLSSILGRIQANQKAFQTKIAQKRQAENDYYEKKYNSSNKA